MILPSVARAVTVGVIANPVSGRDIRRLVSGASVFDNAEKGNMVYRLLVGLGAAGVDRVLMMPAENGVSESLRRRLRGRAGGSQAQCFPVLEPLDMVTELTARDTAVAVELMAERGVAAIVVLGGDGTHRVAARQCGDIPVCALSTGTNNAFARIREATVAGLATGLVASGRVGEEALRREKLLLVGLNGDPRHDCALVDVAVSAARWTGARALWRIADVSELFVAFAEPGAVGLSAVAALVDAVPRSAGHGLYARLVDPAQAAFTLTVPLAPGLVVPVGVAETRRIRPGEVFAITHGTGCLALDGEREIELRPGDRAEVRLEPNGPLTIDVEAVMALAANQGLLREPSATPAGSPRSAG